MSNPGFFTSTTAGSIGAENLVSEINANGVTRITNNILDNVVVPIFLSKGFNSNHVHTSYITLTELNNLMMGIVSSVVRASSNTSNGTSHTHTITYTWNQLNGQLVSSVDTSLFHIHPGISGVQPDPLSHADIKRETATYEETRAGFIRLKHDWKIEDGFQVFIVEDSEILIV